jgi:peroxiredoxin
MSSPITTGSSLPTNVKVRLAEWSDKPQDYCGISRPVETGSLFTGRKVVLFSVPGAFTSTCHLAHMKGFVDRLAELKQKVDAVVCTAVNDPFVMGAWARAVNAQGIEMVADGNGDFARAIGLTLDLQVHGMGTRGQRFAAVVDNGVIKYLGVGDLDVSGVDAVFKALESL